MQFGVCEFKAILGGPEIFFFCSGEREGDSEAPGGGSRAGGAGGEGVCGEFFGGGGGKIFFSGPKFPPRIAMCDL